MTEITGMIELEQERREFLRQLLDHPLQDDHGLNDIQRLPVEQRGLALASVGIERFRLPVLYPHPYGAMNHDTQAALYVNLRPGKVGLNMSRMVEFVQSSTEGPDPMTAKKFLDMAEGLGLAMRDEAHESPLESAKIEFCFLYALKQVSLKSERWGWQYYDSKMIATHRWGRGQLFLVVSYEYSATCPCALSMSKQYESEFHQSLRRDGFGVAVPHSQRACATVTVELSAEAIDRGDVFLAELVDLLRVALPTETQSLAKRIDEQAFAILNGSNPLFVEHAAKYVHQVLDSTPWICDWHAKLEHFESLHSHNAVAEIYKGIQEGLRNSLHH